MKRLILAAVALSLFAACDEKPKNPVAEYGDAVIGAYKRGQQAGEIASLDAIRKTVQAYHAANDKYPQGIDEIKDLIGSNIDLAKCDYDLQRGIVSRNSKDEPLSTDLKVL